MQRSRTVPLRARPARRRFQQPLPSGPIVASLGPAIDSAIACGAPEYTAPSRQRRSLARFSPASAAGMTVGRHHGRCVSATGGHRAGTATTSPAAHTRHPGIGRLRYRRSRRRHRHLRGDLRDRLTRARTPPPLHSAPPAAGREPPGVPARTGSPRSPRARRSRRARPRPRATLAAGSTAGARTVPTSAPCRPEPRPRNQRPDVPMGAPRHAGARHRRRPPCTPAPPRTVSPRRADESTGPFIATVGSHASRLSFRQYDARDHSRPRPDTSTVGTTTPHRLLRGAVRPPPRPRPGRGCPGFVGHAARVRHPGASSSEP